MHSNASPQGCLRLFTALQGSWTLWRTARVRRGPVPSGVFIGQAIFAPRESHCLAYEECGRFKSDDNLCFTARRRYLYALDAHADRIAVHFDEVGGPRLFYEFGPAAPIAQHVCGEDLYEATHGWKWCGDKLVRIQVRYRVWGPHNDYELDGVYTPA
jgi:hypothetical protein